MGNSINTFKELKAEKEKLAVIADDRLHQMKDSFQSVTKEGRSVMVNKILIPVGIAVVAGYGIKKLIDFVQSHDDEDQVSSQSGTRTAVSGASHASGGLLSRINWSALAVQLVPFVINVGKRMYEEGNLPYFSQPAYDREEEEI